MRSGLAVFTLFHVALSLVGILAGFVVVFALLSAKILKNATLKVYPGFPHGMPTTNADQINADLLAFLQRSHQASA